MFQEAVGIRCGSEILFDSMSFIRSHSCQYCRCCIHQRHSKNRRNTFDSSAGDDLNIIRTSETAPAIFDDWIAPWPVIICYDGFLIYIGPAAVAYYQGNSLNVGAKRKPRTVLELYPGARS
jgi:hypothetical protein